MRLCLRRGTPPGVELYADVAWSPEVERRAAEAGIPPDPHPRLVRGRGIGVEAIWEALGGHDFTDPDEERQARRYVLALMLHEAWYSLVHLPVGFGQVIESLGAALGGGKR